MEGGITLSGKQLGFALEEITRTARALSCIGMVLESEEGNLPSGLGIAVECLAQRVGWLSDMVRENTAGHVAGEEIRGPLLWSLPPVFFQEGLSHD